MSRRAQGYLLLSLAMMTVGTTVIASKVLAGSVPPFQATALRFALALPVMLWLLRRQGAAWPRLGAGDRVLLVLQAAAGSVGYTVLLVMGLAYLPAADAGVIIGTLPAVSALFSVLVLGERPGLRQVVSAALATLGVMAVAWKASGPSSGFGMLCVFGAVLCESAFILLNKRMRQPLGAVQQATVMVFLGLLVSAPAALLEGPLAWPAPASLGALAWYAWVPTAAGFLLWYAGSSRVSGGEAATFTAVAPLTAVALAAVLLGEPLGLSQGLGIGAVVLAILVLAAPLRSTANR
ncbi:DMT family transporter [Metapseudomonas otitidis]|uniref:DMT family transporter n=1 Tax=Metapseudomonas otitidis TaxID=319939 RepID=UPI0013F59679|nr:DMT family transporter [Pseudomonas otitidis]